MSIRGKIICGFILSLLTLGLLGVLAFRSTAQHAETAHVVTQTQEVLARLSALQGALVDAETGQRGYLLTGHDRYLGPYISSMKRVPAMLAVLSGMGAPRSRQQQRLDLLRQLIGEKLDEMRITIELRRDRGIAAAIERVNSDRGMLLMDRIRAVIADMENEEKAVLLKREAAEARSARGSLLYIGGGTLLALLILSLGSLILIRSVTVPISRLVVGAEKIGGGALDYRIGITSHDEIGVLASAFNRMAERRQQAEEVLSHQSVERQHFYENVSHELRTPLSLILGPAERLLDTPDLPREQREDLLVIRRNARTLLKHANDLLDAARLEAGRIAPSYAEVDLCRLAQRAASHFDSLARDRGVNFTLDLPESLPAQLDPDMFQRIVLNLLANAFKFIPEREGAKVACALRKEGEEYAVLEVSDNGPGIPADVRQAVFERFRQVQGGTVQELGGTGLGLSIVKDFVSLHGGTAEVLEAPIGGALVRVRLRLRAPEGAPVRTDAPLSTVLFRGALLSEELSVKHRVGAAAPLTPGTGGTIVLVEDNPEMNRFLCEILGKSYRVRSARDGVEGLEMCIGQPDDLPDLVLTDIMMPRMTGEQLIAELRRRPELGAVPIVVLTAKADDELRVRLLREGAQDYVLKPFHAEEVSLRVGNLMAYKRARDVLSRELSAQQKDLLQLATEVTEQKHRLQEALSEMKAARDEAEHASQIKSNFLSLLSHEVRTPLTSLQLQVELLRRSSTGGNMMPRQLDLIERIGRSGRRVLSMMDAILQYAKLQSGRVQQTIEPLDLYALCQEGVEEILPQAQHKGLVLRLLPASGPVETRTDRYLLHRVLMNLLSNAIKYTESGAIEVSLSCRDGTYHIAISDTGPGIPEEQHALIFEPFEQLEPIHKKHKPGVGLGLAIVKRTMAELGGRIELSSTVGRGSTFTVVLPVTPPEGALAPLPKVEYPQ